MVKSRFSSLDVRAMVNSIRPEAVGCKLANIYDVNSKVYILKLSRTGFKRFLLLESGMRFHLTDYQRDKSSTPSAYTMKLRKHIRTRRLTSIQQLGADRSIDFTFGRGDNSFHLILELYVSGNLILTDHEYRILALLRSHTDQSTNSRVAVKQIYPLELATGLLVAPLAELGTEIDKLLDKASDRQRNQEDLEGDREDDMALAAKKKGESVYVRRSNKKRVDHVSMPLHVLLHKLAPWSDPHLCALCVSKAMLEAEHRCEHGFKVSVDDLDPDELVAVVTRAAELALDTLRSVSRPDDLGGGHMPVLAPLPADGEGEEPEGSDDEDEEALKEDQGKRSSSQEEAPAVPEWEAPIVPGWIMRKRLHIPPAEPHWVNDEFTPLPPEAGGYPEATIGFPNFHLCVDEFYTKLEEHKVEESKAQHAQNVYAKVDRIRVDQGRRIEQLEAEQGTSQRQATLIEANVELVERALMMLNTMIASQVDWGELWREVKRQQRLGHPIAQHIHSLDLARNQFQMLLGSHPDADEFDADDGAMETVPLDLSLSAHANVARLHSKRKETREKTSRTVVHAETAVKQAERKAQQDLKKYELKQTLRRVRQSWWFEKFFWFISSENYLVLAARDSNQIEQIFCKYLSPKDVFVQADVHGARSCFIKNCSAGEVPPATLREAGTLALCHSSAWDKHMVISAWWAPVEQVVRLGAGMVADNDSILVDGFMVRGQRHFLPPVHLEMGFTILFHVTGSAAERHRGERRSRYLQALGADPKMSEASDEDGEEAAIEVEPDSDPEASAEAADDGLAPEVLRVDDGHVLDSGGNAAGDETGDCELHVVDESATALTDDVSSNVEVVGSERTIHLDNGGTDACSEVATTTAQEVDEQPTAGGGGRISKAERKRLKKGSGDEVRPAPQPAQPTPPTQPKEVPKAVAKAPLRGQKAKAKKIKEKYADQDDEERELRLTLLGSKASKLLSAATCNTDASGVPAETSGEALAPVAAPATPEPSGHANVKSPEPPTGSKGGGPKGNKKPQHAVGEVLRPGCDLDTAADLQLAQLDFLTGQPSVEDEVLYAMPMVAPYCSLGGPYSLRVKLTPGPTKKGQAAKTCLRMLEAQLEKPSWKPLVQAIPENDAASIMCGACKLAMPGMQKLHAQVKRDQKKEKQAQEKVSKK